MIENARGHVLLVDDHIEVIDYVRSYLERNGYTVTTAESGEEALKRASEDVDVIFLDVWMPNMSGIDVCRALRGGKHMNTPIIFMTADNSESSEIAGLDVGGDEYLIKPISAVALEKRVVAYMRKAKEARNLQIAVDTWREEAFTDALTGTQSRRYAEFMMQEKISGWVIMCDIDNFKLYNDTFGHEAGDVCLKSIASTLMQFGHEVVRMGGEEFLILVQCGPGRAVAQHIVKKIKSNIFRPDGQPVTVSVGAVFVDNVGTLSKAVRHADMLLYRSKHNGRNTATFGILSDGLADIPNSDRRCFRGSDERN